MWGFLRLDSSARGGGSSGGGKMVIFSGEWNVEMKRGERDRSISR